MSVGRNDPCPCGSGRKYKQCCLAAQDLVEARWLAWRQAEGAVVPAVADFALGEWGAALFEAATEIFFVNSAPPADKESAGAWEQLFTPWFVFDFVPEPRRRGRGEIGAPWPTTLLALEYARLHANELSPHEHRFLRAACEAPLSFAAVTAVDPGRSIDLKDILTGEAHHVVERGASSSLEAGHIILTRVVADGDMAIMVGLGPYPLSPHDHNRVIDFRERFLTLLGPVDRTTLKSRATEVVLFYRQLVEQALNPAPPQLRNTDGDRFEPTTLEFELNCGVREAFDRIAMLSVVRSPEEILEDATRSDAGELVEVEIDWGKKGNRQHRDWDNTTLGQVTLTPGAIRVSVNSAKRAKKIRGLIEKRLGQDVLYLRQTIESVDALLDPSRRRDPDAPDQSAADPFAATPEGRAYISELNRRHWEGWLDGKIPALGNITPRQAAKTPLGRERLEALLCEYAWRRDASPANQITVDVEWIRRQLRLDPA